MEASPAAVVQLHEQVLLCGQAHGIVCPDWAEREELLTAWAEQLRQAKADEAREAGGEGIVSLRPQMLRIYAAAIGLGVPRIARRAAEADSRAEYVATGCSVLVYGGRVYSYLRSQGVEPSQIAEAGLRVLDHVADKLAPRKAEVKEAGNFSNRGAAPQPA